MEIRVKKMCLNDGFTKKCLKESKVKIKRDYVHKVRQVRILILPDNVKLVKTSLCYYMIDKTTGKYLGHIMDPFDLNGGLLTFAPQQV